MSFAIGLGTKRWVEYPLVAGSGTPSAVEAIVIEPDGTQTVVACTLADGYYGVLVTFNAAGEWKVIHNVYAASDPVNPFDHSTLYFMVPESPSSDPFERV